MLRISDRSTLAGRSTLKVLINQLKAQAITVNAAGAGAVFKQQDFENCLTHETFEISQPFVKQIYCFMRLPIWRHHNAPWITGFYAMLQPCCSYVTDIQEIAQPRN